MAVLEDQPDYFRVMVKLALLTGMRRGELLKLTWPNVDLRRNQITVRAHTAKAAKTRVIPLPASAVELLKAWKAEQTVTDMERHVFLNPNTRQPLMGVKRRWTALTKAAQIDDFRFHDCRHDYASRLVDAGVDLYRVKELLGHASIEQTQRYAHLSDDAKRAAVEVLR
jgi:integrase